MTSFYFLVPHGQPRYWSGGVDRVTSHPLYYASSIHYWHGWVYIIRIVSYNGIQWNPSKTDTIGTNNFVHCSEVSLAQGLVVNHAPPTIAASYDKVWLLYGICYWGSLQWMYCNWSLWKYNPDIQNCPLYCRCPLSGVHSTVLEMQATTKFYSEGHIYTMKFSAPAIRYYFFNTCRLPFIQGNNQHYCR